MKDIFLLDMDETLLDFPAAEHLNFFLTLKMHGVVPHEDMYARFHAVNDGLWKLLEQGGITREALKVRRFSTLFEEFGISADAEAVSEAYYANFREICVPYEGAAAFLKKLAARGRVYLVTNGGVAIQTRHIELAGFGPCLSGVFISEAMGETKPSYGYAAAVKAGIEGFDEARAVYLGDSLTSDMVCAERMNVDFVLYAKERPAGYRGRLASTYFAALRMFSHM